MIALRDKHWGFLGCAVRSAGRLLLGVTMARFAGVDGYAAFVLLITTEVLCSAIANARCAVPLLSIAPGLSEAERGGMERMASERAAATARWFAVIGLLAAWTLADSLGVASLAVGAFTAAVVATVMADCARAVRQARFESRRTVVADALSMSMPLAGFALLQPDPENALVVAWSGVAIGQLLAFAGMRAPKEGRLVSEESRRDFVGMARPLVLGSAVLSLTGRSQPYILGAVAGTAQLSCFGASMSLVGPLRLLAGGLSSVLRPRLALGSRAEDGAASATLRKALILQAIAGASLFLGLLLLAEPLVLLVFGEGFSSVAGILPLAALYATLEGGAALLVVSAQTRYQDGATRATASRAASGVLSLCALAALAPLLGAQGALWGMIAGELCFVALLTRGGLQEVNRLRSIP